MKRRTFLKAALAAAPLAFRTSAWAQNAAPTTINLKALSRTLDINGRAAKVYGLLQADGTRGVRLDTAHDFDVSLTNDLTESTLIHWHGMTPPHALDGVPGVPLPLMAASETRRYTFPIGEGGTHWMHAHTLQEQALLAAPLIVRTAEDLKTDEQEVVMLLHDFSFKSGAELLAELQKPSDPNTGHMQHGGGMMMDSNDIDYDAYLANEHTLADPEIVKIEKSGKVRLRIINGATATIFTLDTGVLTGEVIAVDGQKIRPVKGTRFPLAMGQRIDIRLDIPKEGGAFPILALRENAVERTGLVLATAGASIAKIAQVADKTGPIMNLELEGLLRAAKPLAARKTDRRYRVMLTGSMGDMGGMMGNMMKGMGHKMSMSTSGGYEWALQSEGPLKVKKGERIELAMHNMSMMTHPMHLHGHHFQVVSINGQHLNGAMRDTVAIPHMAEVVVAFDANNVGKWAFHCHHLYHMATGMMSFVEYEDV